MNTPDEPLTEHVLDELLSADLDGELAAAAADLGLTIEQARNAIGSPEAATRRAALAHASGVVGAPVPLDADAAARLVTTSITRGRQDDDLGAARSRRERRADTARRVLVAAGSAAAVIAVIVGLGNMSNSTSDKDSTAAPTEGTASYDGAAPTGDFALGDVSSADALRRRVEARLRTLPGAPSTAAGGTTSPLREANGETSPPAQPTGTYAIDGRADGQFAKATCAPAARAAGGGSAPVLTGSAVSDGRPVSVYVFRRAGGYDVVVVDRDCTVVTRVSLP